MTSQELVEEIDKLPPEEQRVVIRMVELLSRKHPHRPRTPRRQRATPEQRLDAEFWATVPSVEELAAQQGVQPIRDTESLRGNNIWPQEDDIDEFVETVHRWRREGTPSEDQP